MTKPTYSKLQNKTLMFPQNSPDNELTHQSRFEDPEINSIHKAISDINLDMSKGAIDIKKYSASVRRVLNRMLKIMDEMKSE